MIYKKINLTIFLESKLLTENLQEGVQKLVFLGEKRSLYSKYLLMDTKKSGGYLGKSLLDPSIKCTIMENPHKVESSLKNQTQESTKLGLKPLRHGVRTGA